MKFATGFDGQLRGPPVDAEDGTIFAIRRVTVEHGRLDDAGPQRLATSPDGSKLYATFTKPGKSAYRGGVLELAAFP